MDRFHLLHVFVAVADEESFAGAARRLKLSPPAVTRAIVELEDRLGVRLLTRTTRVVRVTEVGTRYLEDARRILTQLDEADAAAAGINATPSGDLSITAPVLFGYLYVTPIITEYQSTYEHTKVTALFVDRVVNFMEEGMDIGIRIGELPDSSLRALPVGKVRRVVVGSKHYFEQHGVPRTPEELTAHRIVSAAGVTPTNSWVFYRKAEKVAVSLKPRIVVNTNDSALKAACLGFGLTRLLSYQIAPQLESGELIAIMEDFEGPPLPVHVLHREGRHGSAKVRSFVDLCVKRLRANVSLNPN